MEKAFRLRNSMAKSFKSLLFQQKEHWILSYQKMLCGAQTRKEGHTMFKQRGSHEEMLKKIGNPTVRTFEAICHRCGMRKIYRYGPGQFGPHSHPRWLYERMEDVVCQDWGQQPAPVMARKEQNAQM